VSAAPAGGGGGGAFRLRTTISSFFWRNTDSGVSSFSSSSQKKNDKSSCQRMHTGEEKVGRLGRVRDRQTCSECTPSLQYFISPLNKASRKGKLTPNLSEAVVLCVVAKQGRKALSFEH